MRVFIVLFIVAVNLCLAMGCATRSQGGAYSTGGEPDKKGSYQAKAINSF